LTQPTQHDGTSCGVYCLEQAYSCIRGTREFEAAAKIGPQNVEVMRMLLLWEILHHPATDDEQAGRPDDWIGIEEIGKEINRYFPNKPSPKQ